jgi:iron(II)-dependent oxidoreductase
MSRPVPGRETLARDLAAARARTLMLTDHEDAELYRQYDPLMSPLVWDLAHIGQQEELWLLRDGDPGRPSALPGDIETLYDAFRHSRASRVQLPLLSPAQARSFCYEVRGRVLDRLDALPAERPEAEFAFAMVLSHEHQHDETMLQALSIRQGAALLRPAVVLPAGRPAVAGTSVLVPEGPCTIGVDAAREPFSLDNERPAHTVHVKGFRIGTVPVTNGEWSAFVEDGGYRREGLWTATGWAYRQEAGLIAPKFWNPDGTVTRFGHTLPVHPDEPVQHVGFHEAQAYAAWAGARLPTEVEWEKACAWDPKVGARRRFPWGYAAPDPTRANLGGAALGPAPVGAYPSGASAYGAEQMLGDVWEWTTSPLRPWPGFTPMVYQQYSEPFFAGDYRVLRGGSWAVDASILRPSFRNWDHPIRRQIFSGVRLAWDIG